MQKRMQFWYSGNDLKLESFAKVSAPNEINGLHFAFLTCEMKAENDRCAVPRPAPCDHHADGKLTLGGRLGWSTQLGVSQKTISLDLANYTQGINQKAAKTATNETRLT
jgi:hypothetical protein